MRIVTLFLIIIMLSSGVGLGSLGLNLTKTCNESDADYLEDVSYNYSIQNIGNETLHGLKLTDSRLGNIPLPQTKLTEGNFINVSVPHTINATDMPGPLRNSAVATALGPKPLSNPVTSNTTNWSLSVGFSGNIKVKKKCLNSLSSIKVGSIVTYQMTVTNPRSNGVALRNVSITEDILYSPYPVVNKSITLNRSILNPGETATGSYNYTVKQDDIQGPPDRHSPVGQFDLSSKVWAEGYPVWLGSMAVTGFASLEVPASYTSKQVVTKFASPSEGGINSDITYKIFVNNAGDTLLNRTELWDLLPAGLDYVSSNPVALTSPNVNGTTTLYWSNLSQTLGFLLVGGKYEVEVKAKISGSHLGTLRNRVTSKSYNLRNESVTSKYDTTIEARKQNINVVKTRDISSGTPGAVVNFTLTIKNTGNITLKNVFVSDILPLGMSYLSSSPGDSINSPHINWSDIGSMLPKARLQLWIKASIDGPISGNKTLTNRVNVEGRPEYGSNVTDNDTAIVKASEPKIIITKTANPTFGSAGTLINFTLNVTNTGAANLPHVFVNDVLPIGLTYDSSSSGGVNIGQTVYWSDIGPMASGSMRSLWIKAKIDGSAYGALINQVDVEGSPEHGNNVTDSAKASVQARKAKISVTKTSDPAFGSAGSLINFSMNVSNNGVSPLHHVFVSDLLPAGLTYDSSSPGSTRSGQNVNWSDIGPMSSGSMRSLWIKAKIDGSAYGALINQVDVAGSPEHGNNVTDSAKASVQARKAKISVSKTSDPTFGSPSTNVNFTLVVNNTGSTPLPHVFVSDLLPAGMSYVSSSEGSTRSGQNVNWGDIGPMGSGASKVLWIVAHIDGPISGIQTLTNRVDVEGKPEHGQNVTNSSTADVKAEGANIMVRKTAAPIFGSVGALINFTINVTNNGAAWLQNVSVSDKLPAGLTYDSSSTGSVNSGQNVNWTEIGPMPVGDMKSLWIRAKIDGTFYGTLTNLVFVTGKPHLGDPVTNTTTKDVTALNLRSISGRKFNDLDGDGTLDGDTEQGLPGWKMELLNESGQIVAVALTNESGIYEIEIASEGMYTLREVSQVGWNQTAPAQGYYALNVADSDAKGMDFANQWWENTNSTPLHRINVTKVAYPTSASPGAEISFVIIILNNGRTHLIHVNAVDTLPSGMSYISDNRSESVSVSGRVVSWNDLDDLDPGASIAIHLVAGIDRDISGMLSNVVYVNATDPAGGEVNDSAWAEVQSLLPNIAVTKTVSKEPVQYGQYCEAKTLSGVGIIESRTSIEDKTIALEYDNALAGEGKVELESAEVMSETAEKLQRDVPSLDPENQSSLNFFEETKLAFQGAKPLTGGKSIHSMAFYGGSGAEIKDIFSVDEMEKEQTTYFGSTDQASSPHTIGTDLKSSFNGTTETYSKMHNMFSQDQNIKSRQVFSGVFNLVKVIKFHTNATTDEPKMGCEGIDC